MSEGGKEEVRCKVNGVQEEVRGKVNRFQGGRGTMQGQPDSGGGERQG
jgi:hypothetical protein